MIHYSSTQLIQQTDGEMPQTWPVQPQKAKVLKNDMSICYHANTRLNRNNSAYIPTTTYTNTVNTHSVLRQKPTQNTSNRNDATTVWNNCIKSSVWNYENEDLGTDSTVTLFVYFCFSSNRMWTTEEKTHHIYNTD